MYRWMHRKKKSNLLRSCSLEGICVFLPDDYFFRFIEIVRFYQYEVNPRIKCYIRCSHGIWLYSTVNKL